MSAVRTIRRCLADERGVSAIEFALILPLLVLFSVGTIDVSRLIVLTMKLQSAAFTLADLSARIDKRETATLGNVFLAIDQVVKPFDFAGKGRAIVTSVQSPSQDNAPSVAWQCSGKGLLLATSGIGQVGRSALIPAGLDIRKGETVIAAEVYFNFTPLFGIGLLPARVIRQVAYFKPRLGELTSLSCPA